ncbi:hypothetical protein [Mechercharimyces sp. CAU 1602]|uniref:hypothetical protein n=1 Tax=Mechercharimyces sp. CAU 1602 TaxID=2973933 RepID=UPI0021616B73|nr:hypothetical protein [Mechercharimyces sp. CAU 1602]MCS1350128.1 hypothetical protein [Mechercharimyces sp. CAU 1602]
MRIKIFVVSLLVFLGCCSYPYSSLHDAIQSEWDYPIKIMKVDEVKNIVVFLNGENLYVFNKFVEENKLYKYSNEGENGFRLQNIGSDSVFLRIFNDDKVGNVVWGVSRDREADRVVVIFENKLNPSKVYEIDDILENNVFVGYPEKDFFENQVEVHDEWNVIIKVYDDDDNIITEVNNVWF